MAAVSAMKMGMVQAPAINKPNPRIVVTPLIVDHIKELLCKYNLLDDWLHILSGIYTGFDVGKWAAGHYSCGYTPLKLE
ncbi:hypothetical protein CY34DRAFT_19492 [Suillus luteus UH-Slu-Lm8-n1]|uniref:Uncharacterized protein n=1 Tax=Suillus luteus UH-Slu-Lm8-n1 TaxID=930992 RepID=A0A0D0AC98_9AGAM|nr:hypothetical protein CY34DRAFT_19492 [Suillus luteus UH-Slu-Lm8-n1]